jgi:hypothetical protein
VHLKSDTISGLAFGGSGLERGVAFDGSVLVRGVAFGGSDLVRVTLLYTGYLLKVSK